MPISENYRYIWNLNTHFFLMFQLYVSLCSISYFMSFFFLQTWLGSVLKTSSGFTPTDVETQCYTVISDSPTFQHDSSYTCNVDTIWHTSYTFCYKKLFECTKKECQHSGTQTGNNANWKSDSSLTESKTLKWYQHASSRNDFVHCVIKRKRSKYVGV